MSTSSLNAIRRAGVASFLCLALLLSACIAARASELQATKDFADVAKTVEAYIAKYGAEHVLLVLDIDNTVMSMDTDLGSDHWFEWQNYLLANEPDSPHLVAKTFPELLKAQGILYDRGKMHPTQPDEPKLIGDLQKQGISAILLTSRGPEFRGVTERELKRCGYDFKSSALPVHDVPKETFLPYDPAHPEQSGLTAEELTKYKLGTPRPVLYTDGIFMTAGQHKGMMLLTLLKKANRDIKAIVYVDDNLRHVGAVFSAAVARNIEVSSFQYQREDMRVQKFWYSDKGNMDSEWAAVKGGAQVVSVSKPSAEKPTLQADVAPSAPAKQCVPKRRCRILQLCR
jgi:hypothetical protein